MGKIQDMLAILDKCSRGPAVRGAYVLDARFAGLGPDVSWRRGWGLWVIPAALTAWLVGGLPAQVRAEDVAGESQQLVECGSTVSLDKRLVMQQWARPGACAEPVQTRVTDRFLGFTCVAEGTSAAVCRGFAPAAQSRAFDTTNFFRCYDLGLTGSMEGFEINRLREWAGRKDQCDWDANADVLAMEVDFGNGQVCVASLCMPVTRLSVIGKVRLRHLIESAFRELDPGAQTAGPQAVRPARASPR
jgi:hypothetical protein